MNSENFKEIMNICRTQSEKINDTLISFMEKELRDDIASFMLRRKGEEDFYDVCPLFRKWKGSNAEQFSKEIISRITKEIEDSGYKTALSFGGTGLFIYTNEKPLNCW